MIYAIVPPESAQQPPAPHKPWTAPGPRLTGHEQRLLAAVRQAEGRATVWQAVNGVTRELAPRNRAEARHLRVTLLCSLNRLLRLGRLQREDRNSVKVVEVLKPVAARNPTPPLTPQPRVRVFEV